MAFSAHSCKENRCIGSKFAGITFVCYKCANPTFIECVSGMNEIKNFLKLVKINEYDGTNIEDYKNDCKKKMKYLFSDSSLFRFICSSCQMNQITEQCRNEYENKISELENQLSELKNRSCNGAHTRYDNNESKTEIEMLKSKLDENNKSIQVLSTEIKTAYTIQLSQHEKIKTDFENTFETTLDILKALDTSHDDDLQSRAYPWINIKRRGNRMGNKNQSENQNDKEKNNSPFEYPKLNNNEHTSSANQSRNDINPNRGLYEIYVSKFQTKVKPNEIAKFIMESTKITDNASFSVQLLGGFWNGQTFASFKITTLTYDVCMEILNMNWSPQSARIFTTKKPIKTSTNPFGHNDNRENRKFHDKFIPRHYQPSSQNFNHRTAEREKFKAKQFGYYQGLGFGQQQQHQPNQNNDRRPFQNGMSGHYRANIRQPVDRERVIRGSSYNLNGYHPLNNGNWNQNFNPEKNDFLYRRERFDRRPTYPNRMGFNNYQYR